MKKIILIVTLCLAAASSAIAQWSTNPAGNTFLTNTARNVGIGVTNPTNKLEVCGQIKARSVVVELGWCDYVFASDYKLMPLTQLEAFIKAHKHLPEVPTEQQVAANGVSLGDATKVLLLKVEELTLYLLQQQKEIDALKQQLAEKK